MLKKYIVDLLEDNPLNGISTYNDVLTLSTGTISRKIKKLVLTGNETITVSSPYYLMAIDVPTNDRNNFICSHFGKSGYTGAIAQGTLRFAQGASIQYDTIIFNYDNGTGGEANFKTYLAQQYSAGTPVTIWYVLANETTEQITVPTGLSGTVDGYTTQTGTPTPTNPIYPTANTVTMWANYTPSRYNGIAFVTATGQPEQYNGGWT